MTAGELRARLQYVPNETVVLVRGIRYPAPIGVFPNLESGAVTQRVPTVEDYGEEFNEHLEERPTVVLVLDD